MRCSRSLALRAKMTLTLPISRMELHHHRHHHHLIHPGWEGAASSMAVQQLSKRAIPIASLVMAVPIRLCKPARVGSSSRINRRL